MPSAKICWYLGNEKAELHIPERIKAAAETGRDNVLTKDILNKPDK